MDCVFCGVSGPLSGEHVWPDWLKNAIPPMREADEKLWTVRETQDRQGEERQERSFPIVPFSQTVNCVCAACNNNWMNDIETDAQGVLKSVLVGNGRDIAGGGQINVATWVALRALVLQYIAPQNLTAPRHMYEWLYSHRERKDREPPANSNIWIGAYTEGDMAPQYAQSGLAAASDDSDNPEHLGFAATFTVGHLVAHIVGFERTVEDPEPIQSKRISDILIRLWPPSGDILRWPPKKVLTPRGVASISDMFGRPGGA